MRASDLDYVLPPELIAQAPLEPRDSCRLLCVERGSFDLAHKRFDALPELLAPGDVLVLNNSRVLPARLFGTDERNRKFEVLLLSIEEERADGSRWRCLVKPGKKITDAVWVRFPHEGVGTVTREGDTFFIDFPLSRPVLEAWLEKAGHVPLPPYVRRPDNVLDRTRYQTVFAKENGSVAAPTAGLHFTEGLLKKIRERGVGVEEVTLHVGYGTFAPLQSDDLSQHRMHSERYAIDGATWARLQEAKQKGGRIIAVGTTALRTLEAAALTGTLTGSTDLFVQPGFEFRLVDGLVTNFHLPRTTLLVLVAALLGPGQLMHAYEAAVKDRYRFFSYGDAMVILPKASVAAP